MFDQFLHSPDFYAEDKVLADADTTPHETRMTGVVTVKTFVAQIFN